MRENGDFSPQRFRRIYGEWIRGFFKAGRLFLRKDPPREDSSGDQGSILSIGLIERETEGLVRRSVTSNTSRTGKRPTCTRVRDDKWQIRARGHYEQRRLRKYLQLPSIRDNPLQSQLEIERHQVDNIIFSYLARCVLGTISGTSNAIFTPSKHIRFRG